MEKNEIREMVGMQLATIRKKKRISQEELASKTGLCAQNISRIEKGRYNTGLDLIGKIADAMGCCIEINEKKLNDGFLVISHLKKGDCFFDPWSNPCKLIKAEKSRANFSSLGEKKWYYWNKTTEEENCVSNDFQVYPISQELYDSFP